MGKIIGRYAPSPTGDLHLGNLRTALLSWLHARLQGGKFLLRMEDLDTPRVIEGSDTKILHDLEWLGINWDGAVAYQSRRQDLYRDALATLDRQNLVFPCFCSRKELREIASAPHGGAPAYPGTCASLTTSELTSRAAQKDPAMRVRVTDTSLSFNDCLMGQFSQSLASEVGDFVVKRADGLFAYQLAVVVDDIEQGVSHIVRGADLLDSTPRQIYLAQRLHTERETFKYWHLPLVMNQSGQRMAKRDGSESANAWRKSGLSAEAMIGKFAKDLNLIDRPAGLSAEELKSMISIEALQAALISPSETKNRPIT